MDFPSRRSAAVRAVTDIRDVCGSALGDGFGRWRWAAQREITEPVSPDPSLVPTARAKAISPVTPLVRVGKVLKPFLDLGPVRDTGHDEQSITKC